MGQAPSEFTVAGVVGVSEEPWGDNKDMLTTEVLFAGDERQWKIHHNVAWPVAISQGSVLEGWKDFEKGKFGLSNKHKGDHAPPRRARGGAQGGGDKNFDRRPEHPRNEARMIHTSALSAAVPYINQMLAFGVVPAPKDEDEYWFLVKRVADRLAGSYQRVLSDVEAAPQSLPQPSLEAQVPVDTSGLENGNPPPVAAPAGADEDVPF